MTLEEPYRLSLAPAARRALTQTPPIGLPMAVAAAVGEFVMGPLLQRPYVVGKPLTNELAAYHSARRGAYRVVCRIDEKTRSVQVVRIDHRADVYHS
ncbi:type II toxin-antitoxin system RelE family toxin [Catellatospora tritici]|uniref:type II toxin-antitoxin system RelE family toxin n=1 Tax=Catellatospora tritici TaxID=2851566 RepID=UPI001C2DC35D|nr:type II toxin-antitoxin system RelE/ParE family toxin [Catellatospora tritici]MBV1849030.1 type II toxin-antitoxin system RelE/ParE family toxin [Catellatospora tritici]